MDDRSDAPGDQTSTPKTSAPWGPRAPERIGGRGRAGRRKWVQALYVLTALSTVALPAYNELSRPEGWAYWKDLYVAPSLTASLVQNAYVDGAGRRHPALAVQGQIGAAAAAGFRRQLDDAHLVAGDAIILSSPGGALDQAIIIGDIIRSRGLATMVGRADSSGQIRPSFCASACVFAFAGGTVRAGLPGSKLGVHRFTAMSTGRDTVADTQRTTGLVLSYMSKMGIAPSIVEAMTATDDVHWLSAKETTDSGLVTEAVSKPQPVTKT